MTTIDTASAPRGPGGFFARLNVFLTRPLDGWTRVALLGLALCLAASFLQPLWKIHLVAPQYPNGLSVDIYLYKVEGGREGKDVKEINSLNHYIGMATIDRERLADLDWLPFAFVFLILMVLRTAALGQGRDLVDVAFLVTFVTGTALVRFVYQMYQLGHNLDPHAAFKVEPFMPVVIGTKQIANFTTSAWPHFAGLCIGLTVMGSYALVAWALFFRRPAAP